MSTPNAFSEDDALKNREIDLECSLRINVEGLNE